MAMKSIIDEQLEPTIKTLKAARTTLETEGSAQAKKIDDLEHTNADLKSIITKAQHT